MLQKIIDFLKSLFSSFRSTPKTTVKTAPVKTSTSYPTSNLPSPNESEPQDGSEISTDNAVVVIKEDDPIVETGAPVEDTKVDLPGTIVNTEPEIADEPVSSTADPSLETEPSADPVSDKENNTSTETGKNDNSSNTTIETPADIGSGSSHKPRYMWCIDNGHGKKTAGKRSPKLDDGRQLLEYKFNREIVERMVRQLKKNGVEYYIVVPEVDVDNLLKERVRRANAKTSSLPRLFVSVHANAAPAPLGKWSNPSISGVETWYYHNNSRGRKVAAIFQKHLAAATGWKNRHIKSRPTNQFYVLRNTKMTAILTENGFYNNKEQCIELLKESTKDKIAAAHVDAIMEIERRGI